jgi:hypothetical protein
MGSRPDPEGRRREEPRDAHRRRRRAAQALPQARDYLALNDGDISLAGLSAYLAQREDPVFVLSTGHYTGFDFVVEVRGQVVRLTTEPEDLVFQEA